METHIKVLGVLYIVVGAIGVCAAFLLLLIFGAGAAAVAGDADAAAVLPLIGLTGTALFVFLLAVSVPGIIAGIGLLKYRSWARILAIVISAINLINIPLGTIVGLYGLYVLLSEEGTRRFNAPSAAVQAR
jgi:hypothetical protein